MLSRQKPESTWKTILGWAVGIGVVLLAAFAAINVNRYGDFRPSPNPGDPGIYDPFVPDPGTGREPLDIPVPN